MTDAAAGFRVGHVFVRHNDNDMCTKCMACGLEEVVKAHSDGQQLQKFVYQPTRFDGREYVRCEACRRVRDHVIPGAR